MIQNLKHQISTDQITNLPYMNICRADISICTKKMLTRVFPTTFINKINCKTMRMHYIAPLPFKMNVIFAFVKCQVISQVYVS